MKTRSLRWLPLVALTAILGSAQVSFAQPAEERPAKGGQRGMKMLDELGLTDAQKEQVKTILKESMEQRKALKADATLTEDARRDKQRELMKAQQEKIAAILTPEQKTKLEELKKERHKAGREGKEKGPRADKNKAEA